MFLLISIETSLLFLSSRTDQKRPRQIHGHVFFSWPNDQMAQNFERMIWLGDSSKFGELEESFK